MNNDYAGRSILEAARKGITLCVAAALILPPALPPAMSSPQVTHCLAPDSYFRNGHQVSSDERDREIERVIDKAEWFIMKKRFAGNAYRELVALRDKYFAAPPADERSRRILSGLDSMIKSASFLKGKQVKVIEADRKVREFAPGLEKLLSERDALAKRNAELEAAVRAAGDESRGMSTALDVVHRHLQLQSDRLKLGGEDGCAGEMVRISEQFPKFEPIPADLKALERDIAIVSERLDAYARSPAAGQIGHPKLKEENQRAVKSFLKLLGEAAANARRFAELSPKASRAPAALAMNKRRISELDPQISKVKGEEQTFRQILLSAESAFDEQAKKWFAADLLRMRKELMLGAGAGAVTVVSAFGMGGTISGEDALFYLTQKTGKQKRMPLADLAKDMGTAIGKNSAQLLSAVDVIVDETTDAGYHARGGRTAFEVSPARLLIAKGSGGRWIVRVTRGYLDAIRQSRDCRGAFGDIVSRITSAIEGKSAVAALEAELGAHRMSDRIRLELELLSRQGDLGSQKLKQIANAEIMLLPELGSLPEKERRAAATVFQKEARVYYYIGLLGSLKESERITAAEELAKLGDERARAQLMALADKATSFTERQKMLEAATALSSVPRAEKAFLFAKSEDAEKAAAELARLGDIRSANLLMLTFADETLDPVFRLAAGKALLTMPPGIVRCTFGTFIGPETERDGKQVYTDEIDLWIRDLKVFAEENAKKGAAVTPLGELQALEIKLLGMSGSSRAETALKELLAGALGPSSPAAKQLLEDALAGCVKTKVEKLEVPSQLVPSGAVPENVQDLAKIVGMKKPLRYVIGVDISHTPNTGRHTVGGITVFVDGKPVPGSFMRFRISDADKSNDPLNIGKVLRRYIESQKRLGMPIPDLVIVDGGKTQLSGAWKGLSAAEVKTFVTALAKPNEKEPSERLTFFDRAVTLIPDQSAQGLLLAVAARDAVHETAVMCHAFLRTKGPQASTATTPKDAARKKEMAGYVKVFSDRSQYVAKKIDALEKYIALLLPEDVAEATLAHLTLKDHKIRDYLRNHPDKAKSLNDALLRIESPSRTTPDGYIAQGEEAQKEFIERIDEWRENDLTDEWSERIEKIAADAREKLTAMKDKDTAVPAKKAIKALDAFLKKLRSGDLKIYGFDSIVKGPDDFFLGWNNMDAGELFVSEDLLKDLQSRAPPTLVNEYIFHEIMCHAIGHYEAITLQQNLYLENYPKVNQANKGIEKGQFGRILRKNISRSTIPMLSELEIGCSVRYLKKEFIGTKMYALEEQITQKIEAKIKELSAGKKEVDEIKGIEVEGVMFFKRLTSANTEVWAFARAEMGTAEKKLKEWSGSTGFKSLTQEEKNRKEEERKLREEKTSTIPKLDEKAEAGCSAGYLTKEFTGTDMSVVEDQITQRIEAKIEELRVGKKEVDEIKGIEVKGVMFFKRLTRANTEVWAFARTEMDAAEKQLKEWSGSTGFKALKPEEKNRRQKERKEKEEKKSTIPKLDEKVEVGCSEAYLKKEFNGTKMSVVEDQITQRIEARIKELRAVGKEVDEIEGVTVEGVMFFKRLTRKNTEVWAFARMEMDTAEKKLKEWSGSTGFKALTPEEKNRKEEERRDREEKESTIPKLDEKVEVGCSAAYLEKEFAGTEMSVAEDQITQRIKARIKELRAVGKEVDEIEGVTVEGVMFFKRLTRKNTEVWAFARTEMDAAEKQLKEWSGSTGFKALTPEEKNRKEEERKDREEKKSTIPKLDEKVEVGCSVAYLKKEFAGTDMSVVEDQITQEIEARIKELRAVGKAVDEIEGVTVEGVVFFKRLTRMNTEVWVFARTEMDTAEKQLKEWSGSTGFKALTPEEREEKEKKKSTMPKLDEKVEVGCSVTCLTKEFTGTKMSVAEDQITQKIEARIKELRAVGKEVDEIEGITVEGVVFFKRLTRVNTEVWAFEKNKYIHRFAMIYGLKIKGAEEEDILWEKADKEGILDIVECIADSPVQLDAIIKLLCPDINEMDRKFIVRGFARLALGRYAAGEGKFKFKKLNSLDRRKAFEKILAARAEQAARLDEMGIRILKDMYIRYLNPEFNSSPDNMIKEEEKALAKLRKGKVSAVSQLIMDLRANAIKHFKEVMNIKTTGIKLDLLPFQKQGMKFLMDHKEAAILADEQGLGKSVQAIAAAETLGIKRTLIVTPNRVKGSWLSTIMKFTNCTEKEVFVVDSEEIRKAEQNKDQSEKGRKAWEELQSRLVSARYVIVNYEFLRKKDEGKLGTLFPDIKLAIIDEAQEVDNSSDAVQQAAAVRLLKPEMKWLLSGTPYHNKPENLWTLLNYLKLGKYGTFEEFKATYCSGLRGRRGDGLLPLREKLKEIMLRRRQDEVIDQYDPDIHKDGSVFLPRKNEVPVRKEGTKELADELSYTLTEEQTKLIRRMIEDFPKWAEEYNALPTTAEDDRITIDKINPLVVLEKILQVTVDPELVGAVLKSPLVEKIVDDAVARVKRGEKVLVFAKHRKLVEKLQKLINDRLVKENLGNAEKVYGGVTAEDQELRVAAFNNEKSSLKVLVSSIDCGGTGISLTGADAVLFAELPMTYSEYVQAVYRPLRIGSKKKKVDVMTFLGRYPPDAAKGVEDDRARQALEGDTVVTMLYDMLQDKGGIYRYLMHDVDDGQQQAELMRGCLGRFPWLSIAKEMKVWKPLLDRAEDDGEKDDIVTLSSLYGNAGLGGGGYLKAGGKAEADVLRSKIEDAAVIDMIGKLPDAALWRACLKGVEKDIGEMYGSGTTLDEAAGYFIDEVSEYEEYLLPALSLVSWRCDDLGRYGLREIVRKAVRVPEAGRRATSLRRLYGALAHLSERGKEVSGFLSLNAELFAEMNAEDAVSLFERLMTVGYSDEKAFRVLCGTAYDNTDEMLIAVDGAYERALANEFGVDEGDMADFDPATVCWLYGLMQSMKDAKYSDDAGRLKEVIADVLKGTYDEHRAAGWTPQMQEEGALWDAWGGGGERAIGTDEARITVSDAAGLETIREAAMLGGDVNPWEGSLERMRNIVSLLTDRTQRLIVAKDSAGTVIGVAAAKLRNADKGKAVYLERGTGGARGLWEGVAIDMLRDKAESMEGCVMLAADRGVGVEEGATPRTEITLARLATAGPERVDGKLRDAISSATHKAEVVWMRGDSDEDATGEVFSLNEATDPALFDALKEDEDGAWVSGRGIPLTLLRLILQSKDKAWLNSLADGAEQARKEVRKRKDHLDKTAAIFLIDRVEAAAKLALLRLWCVGQVSEKKLDLPALTGVEMIIDAVMQGDPEIVERYLAPVHDGRELAPERLLEELADIGTAA